MNYQPSKDTSIIITCYMTQQETCYIVIVMLKLTVDLTTKFMTSLRRVGRESKDGVGRLRLYLPRLSVKMMPETGKSRNSIHVLFRKLWGKWKNELEERMDGGCLWTETERRGGEGGRCCSPGPFEFLNHIYVLLL